MRLFDIVPEGEYRSARDAGYIDIVKHPHFDLYLHTYTAVCEWDRMWNRATLTCRGLITAGPEGEVVARPFPKMFRVDEPEAPVIPLDRRVWAMDKIDGALGIPYPTPKGWAVAGRDSFTSPEAVLGTRMIRQTKFVQPNGVTLLFEVVHQSLSRVVQYGSFEGLVLLGAIRVANGQPLPLWAASRDWSGVLVHELTEVSLGDVVRREDRDGREGYVIYDPESRRFAKVTHASFLNRAAAMDAVTPMHLWEALASGVSPEDVVDGVDLEWRPVAARTVHGLVRNFERERARLERLFDRHLQEKKDRDAGKWSPVQHIVAPHLFRIPDDVLVTMEAGGDVSAYLWGQVKPHQSEDVALPSTWL